MPEKKRCGVCRKVAGNTPSEVPLHRGAYLDLEGELCERPICEDCVNAMETEQCEDCGRWFHEGPNAGPYEDILGTCGDCERTVCDECLLDHIEGHP